MVHFQPKPGHFSSIPSPVSMDVVGPSDWFPVLSPSVFSKALQMAQRTDQCVAFSVVDDRIISGCGLSNTDPEICIYLGNMEST